MSVNPRAGPGDFSFSRSDLAGAASGDAPLAAAPDGVRITVRLTPRGSGDHLDGVAHRADGMTVLKISVSAPPADGRANDALLQLLSKEWRMPRRDLTIVAGLKSRNKTVHVAGEPGALLKRLAAALAALPKS